jgi:hypothetical protein
VKMDFCCSKMQKCCCSSKKNKKKKRFIPYWAACFTSRPMAEAGLAQLRACPAPRLPVPRQCSTAVDVRYRMDAKRRRWRHLAIRWPPRPSRPPTPSARVSASATSSHCLSSPHSSSSKPSNFIHHRVPPQHPPASCSFTTPSLPDSSCAQLCITFLLLMLAPSPRFALRVRLNRAFPLPRCHGRRSWPRMAGAPSALSLSSVLSTSIAFTSRSSRASHWPSPWLALAGRHAPAPPCHHARRRAQCRARLGVS